MIMMMIIIIIIIIIIMMIIIIVIVKLGIKMRMTTLVITMVDVLVCYLT